MAGPSIGAGDAYINGRWTPAPLAWALEADRRVDEARATHRQRDRERVGTGKWKKGKWVPARRATVKQYVLPIFPDGKEEWITVRAALVSGADRFTDSIGFVRIKTDLPIKGLGRYKADDPKDWHGFGPGSMEGVKWKWLSKGARGRRKGHGAQVEYKGSMTIYGQFGQAEAEVGGTINLGKPAAELDDEDIEGQIEETVQYELDDWEPPEWWHDSDDDDEWE